MANESEDFWGGVWGQPKPPEGSQDFWGGVWGQEPKPAQPFSFDKNNIWDYGYDVDLNPLAAKTGIERDVLANQRDAFIQPLEGQYRSAMEGQGQKVDATGRDLFGDAGFKSFVQSGQVQQGQAPQAAPQTPAQQTQAAWSAVPAQPPNPQRDALMQMLMGRATAGENVDRNSPAVRQQADAYSANEERTKRNYIADMAEELGPFGSGALRGESRMATERMGQRTGAFEAELVGRELQAERDKITHALNSLQGMLSEQDRMALQERLAMIDANLRQQGIGLQQQGLDQDWQRTLLNNDQFLQSLGLQAEDKASYWDAVRRGIL